MDPNQIHSSGTRLPHIPQTHKSKSQIKEGPPVRHYLGSKTKPSSNRRMEAAYQTPQNKDKHQKPKKVEETRHKRIRETSQIMEAQGTRAQDITNQTFEAASKAAWEGKQRIQLSIDTASSVHDATKQVG